MPSLVCGPPAACCELLLTLWVDFTRDIIEELRFGSVGAAMAGLVLVVVLLLHFSGFSSRTAPICDAFWRRDCEAEEDYTVNAGVSVAEVS